MFWVSADKACKPPTHMSRTRVNGSDLICRMCQLLSLLSLSTVPLTPSAGLSTSSWTTSEHSGVVRPLPRLVHLKMKNGNGAGGCWMKNPTRSRRKFSKRLRPLMKRWKNDELERLRKDPWLLWVHTRVRLLGLLVLAPYGAVDSVMPVSHSHHSGRGRDRSEARTRAGARSACSPKIQSKKRRKKRKTLSAAARTSPRRVRMRQMRTLIAVRSLWFVGNWRGQHSSSRPFLLLPRGLQSSRWMLQLRVSLRRHPQRGVPSIFLQSLRLPQRTNVPSRSPFPMRPPLRHRFTGNRLSMVKQRRHSLLLGSRRVSGDRHRSSGSRPLTRTFRYKSYCRLRLPNTRLYSLLPAPSGLRPLFHPHQLSQ